MNGMDPFIEGANMSHEDCLKGKCPICKAEFIAVCDTPKGRVRISVKDARKRVGTIMDCPKCDTILRLSREGVYEDFDKLLYGN